MSRNTDGRRVDTPVAPQQGRGIQRILCIVESRGTLVTAAPLAVVVTQYGDPATCQVIGNDLERLVPQQFLIAVLRTAPRHQHHGRKWPHALGQCQRTVHLDTIGRRWERHLLAYIWIRRQRLLRPQRPCRQQAAPRKHQRQFKTSLPEHRRNGIAAQKPADTHPELYDRHTHRHAVAGHAVHGYTLRALCRRVHHGLKAAAGRLRYTEHKRQFRLPRLQRTAPYALRRLSRRRERLQHDARRYEKPDDMQAMLRHASLREATAHSASQK